LENNLESFPESSLEDLIKHAIKAMKKAQDIKLTDKNIDIGVVGVDLAYTKLKEEDIKKYLDQMNSSGMIVDS
jgi:20S proteasome subunit alpha 6